MKNYKTLLGIILLLILSSFKNNYYSQCANIVSFNDIEQKECPCQKILFTIGIQNPNADSLSLKLRFGDGHDSLINGILTAASMPHSYSSAGTYTIWAIISNTATCIDSVSMVKDIHCYTGGCPTIGYYSSTSFGFFTDGYQFPCQQGKLSMGICADSTVTQPNSIYDNLPMLWDFGDGVTQLDSTNATLQAFNFQQVSHAYGTTGTYTTSVTLFGPGTCIVKSTHTVNIVCLAQGCTDCISSFAPIPGKKYLISAWVKEDTAAQYKTSYNYPTITITYPSLASSAGPFYASRQIIDGWQRLEAVFTIPSGATNMGIKLDCANGDCLFDDIRVHPFDASMKSYVYDPVTMKLVAELDERNYATLYEYDEEGKLIRIKKETEKGVMTIKENRNNTQKN